jgi:hypothetical protein
MRPAALFLVLAVCRPPAAERAPAEPAQPDPIAPLAQTAAHLARLGRFTESSAVYAWLARLQPMSADRCAWELAALNNTLALGNKRGWVKALHRLAVVDRAFAGAPAPSQAQKQACHRGFHDVLAGMVFVWGAELTRGCAAFSWRSWPDLDAMIREFLRDFPDDEGAPQARRQLEDLLILERANGMID